MKVLAVETPSTQTTQVSEGSIQVTLTLHEAVFLRSLLSRVGGDPNRGPRLYADAVYYGLQEIGIPEFPRVLGDTSVRVEMTHEDFNNKIAGIDFNQRIAGI